MRDDEMTAAMSVAATLPATALFALLRERIGTELLTVAQVSRRLYRSEEAVRVYIRSGALPSVSFDAVQGRPVHFVESSVTERFLERRF